jgi:hypothetical protein
MLRPRNQAAVEEISIEILADSAKSLMPAAGKCWEHGQGLDPKLI